MGDFEGKASINLLTREHAEMLHGLIAPISSALDKKVEELHRRGFTHEDPTFVAVLYAMAATYRLRIKLHYESCGAHGKVEPVVLSSGCLDRLRLVQGK